MYPGSERRADSLKARGLIIFLRFIAICQMLALIAVFVPIRVWLAGWYGWLGLGKVPEASAILKYVLGATAFFQAAIGLWLWLMLSNVPRYRPILILTGVIYLVAVPVFYFVDSVGGLPLWWRFYDCVWCFAVGAALIQLCRRSTPADVPQSALAVATQGSMTSNACGADQVPLRLTPPSPESNVCQRRD